MDPNFGRSLDFYLAENLPPTCRFDVHHISTPPTLSPALYSAPPGQAPEKTFCESHFLSVSIISANRPVQVFAIEVLIYTTEHLTTLFVSKADSTGYLYLLKLPQGTPSPFKTIASTFLSFLIKSRRRPATKLVLSLFARAQDQYLFPGSIENSRKHVLTDRGLVKWWCQVLDPILLQYPNANQQSVPETEPGKDGVVSYTSQGFLRVPGCDLYETRAFFPDQRHGRWKASDPLRELGRSETLPERCLIPQFPDDPKARFVAELDDELPNSLPEASTNSSEDQKTGRWKSVRSLEEFWEMMAFRQECSAGRLVGFLWGIFVPVDVSRGGEGDTNSSRGLSASTPEPDEAALRIQAHGNGNMNPSIGSPPQMSADFPLSPPSSSSLVAEQGAIGDLPILAGSKVKTETKDKLSGPNPSSDPRLSSRQPEKTKYYYWPATGRGAVVLREKDYQRVGKLLIHLDYADEKIAAESTEKWIQEVATANGERKWGTVVHGRRELPIINHETATSSALLLDTGLMRKKRRNNDDEVSLKQTTGAEKGINVLSLGHVRKKPKGVIGSRVVI